MSVTVPSAPMENLTDGMPESKCMLLFSMVADIGMNSSGSVPTTPESDDVTQL